MKKMTETSKDIHDATTPEKLPETQKTNLRDVLKINKSMLVTKSSYFFTHTVIGCILPYVTVFLTSVGLSASQAGYINGLRTVVSALFSPIWGAIADHSQKRLVVYLCLAIGTVAIFFPIPWIAKHVNNDVVQHNNTTLIHKNLTTQVKSFQPSPRLFPVMLSVFLLAAAFDFPLIAYQDSLVMRVVTASKTPDTFGPQRVFASIGFGVANLLAGVTADNYSSPGLSSYTAIFFVLLPAGLIMIPLGCIMHKKARWHEREQQTEEVTVKKNVLALTFKTLLKLPNIMFFTTVFVMGLANALVYGFTSLYIEKELHGSKSLIGISFTVSTSSEIPIFLFSSYLIRLLRGRSVCITIAIFSYFVRFLLVSIIENALLIIPIQAMNSIGFALFWVCALEETYAISPIEISTTMVTILNSIHFSLSNFIGSMLYGVLYDKYGGRTLFRGSSFLFLAWGIILIFYHYFMKKCIMKNARECDDQNKDSSKNVEMVGIDNISY